MNAHAPLLSTAVPAIPPDDAPAPTWGALLLELRDAKADFLAKVHLTDSVALGREPTEHEFAIGNAAQDRDMAAIRAVQAYRPKTLTEFLEKAALFADPHLHLGMHEAVTFLGRDAQALKAADAELLRLDEQLGVRAKLEELVCKSGCSDEQATAAVTWTGEVAGEIMDMPPAVTLEGLQAKARAIAWCFSEGRTEFADPTEDQGVNRWADRFFAELLGDQAASPALAAEHADAALVAMAEHLKREADGGPLAEARVLAERILAAGATSLAGFSAQAQAVLWRLDRDLTPITEEDFLPDGARRLLKGLVAVRGHERSPTAIQAISDELREARRRTREADERAEDAKARGDEPARQEAEEAFYRLADAEAAVEDRLLAEPSRGFGDLLVKAQLAADHAGGTVCDGIPELVSADDVGTIAARAVVRDLCAMVGRFVPERSGQVAF